MLSKKHNEPLHWKNKLEALNSLPIDTTAVKDALWNKLNDRLQQKPAGKKFVWYWIAAAILPLMIITLTMVNKTETRLVKQVPQKETNINKNPAFLLPASNEAVVISISAPVDKKQVATKISTKINNEIITDSVQSHEIAIGTVLPEIPVTAITTSNILTTDTITTTIVAKKKLSVVHINELETFPAQFNAPVNYAQSIKPSKSKASGLGLATGQNIPGFKIKLASKN
jgi:hypothetical protein